MNLAKNPPAKGKLLTLVTNPGAIVRFFTDLDQPVLPKLFLIFAALYLVSPIDGIPDITPIIGWLDDLGLLSAAITWVLSHVVRAEAQRKLPEQT